MVRAKKAEESARMAAEELAKKSMEVARMFELVLGLALFAGLDCFKREMLAHRRVGLARASV